MRIARHLLDGQPALAIVTDDGLATLHIEHTDLPSLLASSDGDLAAHVQAQATGSVTPLAEAELLSPVGRPPAILAVGLNYRAHAAEGGREPPKVPIIFNKHHNCIVGPGHPIHLPAAAPDMVDYEGELAVVIGRAARAVSASDAPGYIAGYTIMNDVSVRDWQRRSPTMTMGKSWDTHGPCGPWMVTADSLDPHSCRLVTEVSGDVRQDANTDDLIFDCYAIVEHLSTAFTLDPGTIIATGTPAGVGAFTDPPALLRDGDEVSITIEGIGTLTNPVIAEPIA
ncbi:MAG: fumarylacetoacetate hydrolase family protein [Acidimicrobiales bacterium]|nr:fumarylacetoacetate hydrolase family protein [Acidimicrobiales bacterium]MXX42699.1 fumarylacetoacetate hydrolase family protein [Acidimicrobiales bacterium]MYB81973.1 fumarylacetoacetate hydrolase family protein [Acidimicrobiales bacterium]MYI09714.1 fumarylacetoacetate hydrolase family protein [Acidimicrobiales bacterium]MYI13523.1 fumarylacetoacetate hydrolase family protein [Acidimicrobiales bacterium]